jgi:pimeloyl-ACP methyl ester carboxylesterase
MTTLLAIALAAILITAPAIGVAAAAARTPLIFIPGVLGSMLVRKDDPRDVVFGRLPDSLDRFGELQLPLDLAQNQLVSKDILRVVEGSGGGDQYNVLIARLERLGYAEGRDLFLFPYDWRLSNFHTAAKLRDFIRDNGLADRPLDIIGHSMGGLVALIYMQTYADEQRVRTFVAMGTPFFGSVLALRVLTEGFAAFGLKNSQVVPAGNVSLIYKVFGLSEAIYELLPLYPGCCFVHPKGAAESRPIDLSDAEVFDHYQIWYEKKARLADGRVADRLAESFARLRRLQALVHRPLPETVRPIAVIGSKRGGTPVRAIIQGGDAKGNRWETDDAAGDGTVPAVSARGTLPPDRTLWIETEAEHRHLFDDDAVWRTLGPVLLE